MWDLKLSSEVATEIQRQYKRETNPQMSEEWVRRNGNGVGGDRWEHC